MKFAWQSFALLIGASFTIPSALANFHVIQGIAPGGGAGLEACPSNYYNCNCLKNGDRAAQVLVNGQGVGSLPNNFFSIKAGLCGLPQLNFYKNGNGAWDFYINNGDGSLQGTCYPNRATTTCSGFYFSDQLVCYSYVCGQ
jgi:hypothetical protein